MTRVEVTCPSCLHAETWAGDHREVTTEGGRRRPDGSPELAAWTTLSASLSGELGPVVGACPACAQPMVAEGPLARVLWTIPLPDGTLEVQDEPRIDGKPVSAEEADRRVRKAFRARINPGEAAFSGAMLTAMIFPILVWATAFFVVVWFLYNILAGTVGLSG